MMSSHLHHGFWMTLLTAVSFTAAAPQEAHACSPEALRLINSLVAQSDHLEEDIVLELRGQTCFREALRDARSLTSELRHVRRAMVKGATPAHLQGDLHSVAIAYQDLQLTLRSVGNTPHIHRTMKRMEQLYFALHAELSLPVAGSARPIATPPVAVVRPAVPVVPAHPVPRVSPGYPPIGVYGARTDSKAFSLRLGRASVQYYEQD